MADKEFGEIIKVEPPLVKVRMIKQGTCSSCGHKAVCFPTGRTRVLIARGATDLKEGDKVSIFFPSGPSILSSVLIFVGSVFVPLIAWLVAGWLQAPELMQWISGGAALVLYWVFLIILNRRLKKSGWFLPRASKTSGTIKVNPKESTG